MPEGAYIPDEYVPNKNRKGSFGLADPEGKFMKELVRIDPATPPGRKGPNNPHYHDSLPVEIQIKMDLDLLVKHLYSL